MELRWLEDYIALAKTRHFSRAAEDQNITQPTFSRRIKLLEDEMGTQLVDRNTLPLSLTPAGEVFLKFAEQTASLFRLTQEQLVQISTQHHNKLLLTATQTLYLSYCQDWIDSYSGEANVCLNLDSSTWSHADFGSALLEQRADLAVCHWHDLMSPLLVDDEKDLLEYKVLARDRLLPLSLLIDGSPKYRLTAHSQPKMPYIEYSEASSFCDVMQAHLKACKPQLQLHSVSRSAQALSVKALVLEGYGVGWLPERLVERELDAGILAAASDQYNIDMEIRIYRNVENLKPTLRHFWQALD